MNDVLQGLLGNFVIVYLDDILVYSRTLEDHVKHLREVLTRLRQHKLYAQAPSTPSLHECRDDGATKGHPAHYIGNEDVAFLKRGAV